MQVHTRPPRPPLRSAGPRCPAQSARPIAPNALAERWPTGSQIASAPLTEPSGAEADIHVLGNCEFCTGITNIDPLKYNLLFERFLNPDRKSMPDIDTDFDDEGRQKVLDYVVQQYGKNQVAQIITYGTMAAKSSIKDVARVLACG